MQQRYSVLSNGAGALLLALLVAAPASAQVGLNVDVQALVREEFGDDAPVMLEIARCESKFRQYTDAGNPLYGGYQGRMVGIFQVYSDIHASGARAMGMDIETAEGNIAYARYLYDREGTAPWNSSSSCWRNAAASTENTSASASAALTMDLSLGVVHPQVQTLQQMLNAGGFTITTEGPGSPGNETDMYGSLTRAAVQRFQCAKGIVCDGDGYSTGYGVFGPRTRAALLAHAGTSAPVASVSASAALPEPASASAIQGESPQIAEMRAQIAELQKQLTILLAARQ